MDREMNKGTAFFIITSLSFLIGALSMRTHASPVGHPLDSSVTNSNQTRTPARSETTVEHAKEPKTPRVVVDRNKVIDDASEAEVLAEARVTCENMLRDQSWVFYGFWASERNASDLQMNFPNQLEKYSNRHLEHTLACKRVEAKAYYSVRHYDAQHEKSNRMAQGALLAPAAPIGIFSLFTIPTLKPNQKESISAMEAVCEPRPLEERKILQKLYDCGNTDQRIEQTARFAKNAARRGDQTQLELYKEEMAALEASRPEGCAFAFQQARDIKVTEFVKAPLDSCVQIKN
jgi:hypothetical protein